MKTLDEIKNKLKSITDNLHLLENKRFQNEKNLMQIEMHKTNIAFIRWVLDEEFSECFN